jgi:hypothetical protein
MDVHIAALRLIVEYRGNKDKETHLFNAGTSEGARHILGWALAKFYPEACGRLARRCDRVLCLCSILRSTSLSVLRWGHRLGRSEIKYCGTKIARILLLLRFSGILSPGNIDLCTFPVVLSTLVVSEVARKYVAWKRTARALLYDQSRSKGA